jgi:cellobiose dehydrogenase (acceptor)
LTQIYTEINATNWMLIYRCENCYIFDQPGQTPTNMSTTSGKWENGWAQSQAPPLTPADPFSDISQHDNGMGDYQEIVASATQASYSQWATLTATGTVVTGTATSTAAYSSKPVPTGTTYDYIVIGGGAAGVPIADKLSESGKSVLLIEKGPASSGRWGGSKCLTM